MAIRPPNYNSQGFTLIEMIATLAVAGIIAAFATPSLLSLNKPLRDGSLQFKSQLSLIRSKAISSSKAYRIRPKFINIDDYPDRVARNFVVEYADNCKMSENSATATRWQMASQFDLDLPPNIGVPDTATLSGTAAIPTSLDWTTTGTPGKRICFDNRGILDDTSTKIVLKDFQGFNKAKLAELELTKVGGVEVKTYDNSGVEVPRISMEIDSSSNPIPGSGNPSF